MILQPAERRLSHFIERADLTVKDGVLWKTRDMKEDLPDSPQVALNEPMYSCPRAATEQADRISQQVQSWTQNASPN